MSLKELLLQHKLEMKKNILDRDKLFPGKVLFRDLNNSRYISRKPIYDFLVSKETLIKGCMLDFGCGSMQYKPIFTSVKEYIGLDIEGAKDNRFKPEKDVVYYDGITIPFEEDRFDGCIAIEVLEHVEDYVFSLQEIRRVLKKDGVLLLTVPMTFPLHLEPWDYRRFTQYGLKTILSEVGFREITITSSTTPQNTLRRLRIIEMMRKQNIFTRFFVKFYIFVSNIMFVLSNKESADSKLPIGLMVVCRK